MRIILLSLLLFMVVNTVSATNYYISPNGNDNTGNGSLSRPWRSLFKATSSVKQAGDIIHIAAGEYIETQTCELAAGVSIMGAGHDISIIKSTLTTDWKAILVAASGMEGTMGNQQISQLTFDGQNLQTAWAIVVSGRSNVAISNCTIKDFRNRGVTFTGRIDNQDVEPVVYAKGNRFHDNIMSNCSEYIPGSYGTGCLNIGGQEGMLIYNNSIVQIGRKEGKNGWPIKYVNNGHVKGCKIYNNTLVKRSMGSNSSVDGWDFAIELSNSSGLEIYGNTIQGSVDLNIQTKGSYEYSVWIHDNKIEQPGLNRYMETGITLEYSTEAAVIENNRLTNLGIPIYLTPREGSYLKNIIIRNNTCENIGVAGGSHKGGAIRIGEDGDRTYYLEDLIVDNNRFIGNAKERPYWGISILGLSGANNIQIRGNTLENFSAGCITANPAYVIDTMHVSKNRLVNNGFGNRSAFYEGSPQHYYFTNNVSVNPSFFSLINLKMNVVRPVYYHLKSGDMLLFIIFLIFSIGFFFLIREHIFGFPVLFIFTLVGVILSIEKEYWAEVVLYLAFAAGTFYGWKMWSKRSENKHRLIRITGTKSGDWLKYFLIFALTYACCYLAIYFLPGQFASGTIPWADGFVIAAGLTGLWLITIKKTSGWVFWIFASLFAFPLYFLKHYQVVGLFFAILFVFSLFGLIKWRQIQKRVKTKKHRKITALS